MFTLHLAEAFRFLGQICKDFNDAKIFGEVLGRFGGPSRLNTLLRSETAPTSLICLCLAASLLLCVVIRTLRHGGPSVEDPLLTWEALSSILVPTAHAHPKHYQRVLKHTSKAGPGAGKTISVDFVDLWKKVARGDLEFKDDTVLEDLCLEQVSAFGHTIRLHFEIGWRVLGLWRLLISYMHYCVGRCLERGVGVDELAGGIPNLSSCLMNDTLDLDFVPIPYIGSALLAARQQASQTEETFDVEFTCLAPSIAFMDYKFLFCCAILLPNRHDASKSKKTALPFFTTFTDIVNRLSVPTASGEKAIAIQSVKDISGVHAEALEEHEHDMVFDTWARRGFVARHGVVAWRETRMRLKWEAALLRTKTLVRWKVTLLSVAKEG
ncbi:hypothetical protein DFP72DRAFT_486971 [Ephemerocybe angulata]|uniref:Uncharacterized protein n=1 Tax=Ephemerocybe angulata TaxID=980116 RepID=A0A8H6MFF0_9AGAR|nr:hypothetical protein DFP72DRAFT_486971 [Tulosesus angulatus]